MFGNIGITQLLIVLVIFILLFGTKRLRNFGSDLGSAIKGFKKSMSEESEQEKAIEKKDAEFKEESTKQTDKVKD